MAKPAEQFRTADVTLWGFVALGLWAFAFLSANLFGALPSGFLAGLHASRLDGGNFTQLRTDVAALEAEATQLRQDNSVLLQRLSLSEQANIAVTQRVGALELAVPKLVEAVNTPGGIDRDAITASTGTTAPATTRKADGGSVSYSTTPLAGSQPAEVTPSLEQPLPEALDSSAAPDPSAFGIALGPPIDAAKGSDTWAAMNDKVGTLLIGLSPILAHVEGGSGRRLVAGPLASEADARELCGRMAKVGIACASVPFIGDPLAVN